MSKQTRSFRSQTLLLAAFASLTLLAACSSGSSVDRNPTAPGATATPSPTATPGPDDPTSKNTPIGVLEQDSFASCQAFKDYYAQSLAEEFFSGYSYNRNCFGCEPALLTPVAFEQEDTAVAAPGAAPPADSNRNVTQTNTQEAGVDEADIIETNPNPDATEIYVLRRAERELLIIETSDPANLEVVSRTPLSQDREPTGMFFDDDNQRLAIILTPYYPIYYFAGAPGVTDAGQGAPREGKLSIAPPGDFEQGTQVQFFDVSDPSNPVLQETFLGDGQYVNARRIDERIHLITQFGFPYPSALYDDREYNQLAYEDYRQAYEQNDEAEMQRLDPLIRQKVSDAVNAMAIDDLLPQIGTGTNLNTLACDQIQRSDVNTRMGLLLINSIDTDGRNLFTLGTINNSWQIYASKQSLYLLQNSGGWWFDRAQKQQTAIYRFDISSGEAQRGAVGLVDGWVNNSYQLGEFDGYLRIASTEGRFRTDGGRFSQASHLSVLDISNMETVGEVRDFIPQEVDPNRAETIRSVRFLGDDGYVVTFEQTDPLFNFDLSDPTAPFVAGYVEIPGFSSYIYPLNDDYLLTIGRAAGPDGVGTGRGYQLQIFDVSDPAAPASIAQEEPDLGENGYAYSTAEHQPLAFTFLETASINPLDQVNGLLSIPVQISSSDQADALSGFVAYRIGVQSNAASIDEYTRIDHKDTGNGGGGCPSNRSDLPPEGCNSFAPVIYNEPLRSVIFTEGTIPATQTTTVLTLSTAKLRSVDATGAQAQELDTLELGEE
ncbi:MAG: beta-propeller domain-containing protein [Oceanococcus sp.]